MTSHHDQSVSCPALGTISTFSMEWSQMLILMDPSIRGKEESPNLNYEQ